jgi:hypothetical protein
MGLRSFENGLERMVEGVFSRAFRSSVRPVELGRRMLREMDERRSVDVRGRRIVPNAFVITLSPADDASFDDIRTALVTELVDAAKEYARDEGYHLMGPVTVELKVDEQLPTGRFDISSSMREPAPGRGTSSLVLPTGNRTALGNEVVSIGRNPDCTISLPEANVSRRHAEIRPLAVGWVLVDLGSTNGTRINGVVIDGERLLHDGDVIGVGSLDIRYEAS